MIFLLLIACNRDWDKDGYTRDLDCNDRSPVIHPNAEEICDGLDNDCDGKIDDEDIVSALEEKTIHQDVDLDGFGSITEALGYCEKRPDLEGYIDQGGDCDDLNPEIHPDATEICDEIDNNCNDLVDDADESLDLSSANTFYFDNDGDSAGDPSLPIKACVLPENASEDNKDCNDNSMIQSPYTWEDCDDQMDNDCDGFVDVFDSDCIAQNPFNTTKFLWGYQEEGQTGFAVAHAGDINGDLWPDMLIGSPGIGRETGEVALVVSAPNLNTMNIYSASHIFIGKYPYEHAGVDLDGIGDIQDDGFADFIVGADQTGLHENLDHGYGAVYIVSGLHVIPRAIRGLDEAYMEIRGEEDSAFGNTVAGVGDINGDGFSDYMVSAPGYDTNTAKGVYVFLGGSTYTDATDSEAHFLLAPTFENRYEIEYIGDINYDGVDDIGIGANGFAGNDPADAYIYWGGLGIFGDFTVGDADIQLVPKHPQDRAHYLASIGDVNGDSRDDLFVGAPYNDSNGNNAGEVYVIFGEELSRRGVISLDQANYRLYGDNPGDRLGYVHRGGDLNGDRQKDLLVGAPGYSKDYANQGKLYGLLIDVQAPWQSPNIEDLATHFIEGPEKNARWGRKVAFVGDVDRSGLSDFVLASPNKSLPLITQTPNYEQEILSNVGEVRLLSLSVTGCQDCTEYCDDGIDNDHNGYTDCYDVTCDTDIACAPQLENCTDNVDNDGDGGVDCIDPDCARYPSCPLDKGIRMLGELANSRTGFAGDSAGDIDGDGLADMLFSAPNASENGANKGKVYLLYGSSLQNDIQMSLQFADVIWLGENDGDLLGWTIGNAGDIDNDGLSDIFISAPRYNSNLTDAGAVYIFLASSIQGYHNIPVNTADYIFIGNVAYGMLGQDTVGNININGDGNNDMIISSIDHNQWNQPIGVMHVISPNLLTPGTYYIDDVSWEIHSDPLATNNTLQQVHLANVGDMDGDGLDDIAMGIQGVNTPYPESGGAYITFASSIPNVLSTRPVLTPDIHLYGENQGDHVGFVHGAGDMDGDGLADILIGMDGNEAMAYIHSASRVGVGATGIRNGQFSFATSGQFFSVVPDITGDTKDDYLFHDDTHIYLFNGAQFSLYGRLDYPWYLADYTFENMGGENHRFSVSPDVNGDSIPDIFLHTLTFNQERGLIERIAY